MFQYVYVASLEENFLLPSEASVVSMLNPQRQRHLEATYPSSKRRSEGGSWNSPAMQTNNSGGGALGPGCETVVNTQAMESVRRDKVLEGPHRLQRYISHWDMLLTGRHYRAFSQREQREKGFGFKKQSLLLLISGFICSQILADVVCEVPIQHPEGDAFSVLYLTDVIFLCQVQYFYPTVSGW